MLSKILSFHEGNKYFFPLCAYVENLRTMTINKFQMTGIEKINKVGSKLVSDVRISWLSIIIMIYNLFI